MKKNDSSHYVSQPFFLVIFAIGFLIISVTLGPAVALAPVPPDWAPDPLRNWAYDMRLLIGRPLVTASSLMNAIKGDFSFHRSREGIAVSIQSKSVTLSGTIYSGSDQEGEAKPAILLLHGSTPQGSRLGLYRLLGLELSKRGYVVLAIDQRGYGLSDNPPDVSNPESFSFVEDTRNAIDYLDNLPITASGSIHLIGHSFGGDVAVRSVSEGLPVSRLVLIGPGRRFMARGGSQFAPEFGYFKRREMRYMFLWKSIPSEVFLAYRPKLVLENNMAFFEHSNHPPILLVDGEKENEKDKQFLRYLFERMGEPKTYVTLKNADHYANTANIGSLVFYDQSAVDQLVETIDNFLRNGT